MEDQSKDAFALRENFTGQDCNINITVIYIRYIYIYINLHNIIINLYNIIINITYFLMECLPIVPVPNPRIASPCRNCNGRRRCLRKSCMLLTWKELTLLEAQSHESYKLGCLVFFLIFLGQT